MVSDWARIQIEKKTAQKGVKKKASKFGAVKTRKIVKMVKDGEILEEDILFDSKSELRFYETTLLPLVLAKEIINLSFHNVYELQPKFEKNGRKFSAIKYEADFVVQYKDGSEEIIDVKGFSTPVFKLKQRLFEYKYPDKTIKLVMV